MVSRYNVECGRNVALSLINRDAVDSGNTFRTVFERREKRKGALERVRTDREVDGRK